MNRQCLTIAYVRRVLVLLIAVAAPRALAAQATGGVLPSAAAFPRTYNGNCPTQLEFVGHVTVTVPGTVVDYRWERSDGKNGKVLHARIGKVPARGTPPDTAKQGTVTEAVTSDKWWVGFPGRGGQFWEKLHILGPVDIVSGMAAADITCRN